MVGITRSPPEAQVSELDRILNIEGVLIDVAPVKLEQLSASGKGRETQFGKQVRVNANPAAAHLEALRPAVLEGRRCRSQTAYRKS
jgi:hypothetical protein